MSKTTSSPASQPAPQSDAVSCLIPDPLGILREEHALQYELCDLLEAIADSLPHQFDQRLATVAISMLETGLPRHMRLEDEALFPLLQLRLATDHALQSALSCLSQEHDRDGAMMHEITDGLREAGRRGKPSNPEMLGYMLRGFFESQRRHIAWEDTIVLPAAREALTAADFAHLQDWIMKSEHPRCCNQSIFNLRQARRGTGICDDCPGSSKRQSGT